jgi:hypothetical protein
MTPRSLGAIEIMAASKLKRFMAAQRDQQWFEQYFPDSEVSKVVEEAAVAGQHWQLQRADGTRWQLPNFVKHLEEGLLFALISVRTWIMLVATVVATLLCSPGLLNLRWGASMVT